MGDENQTIRQLNEAPDGQQPMCITFPNGETPFVLKTGLIHLLPTFHGLPTENPHKHLKEFHMVCLSTKPQGVSDDQIKLRAFPFSLSDIAKDWLFDLPPNSVTTWTDMAKLFLDRFFPAAKASEIRRSILSIQQREAESLYEYWERFKKLCANCPQHGLSEQTLLQYFYEGLTPMDMKVIDAAGGGALVNMTPTAAKTLISTMAANSQRFNQSNEPSRRVREVSTVSLENKIDKLAEIVQTLVADKRKTARLCGICTSPEHPTDCCPMIQEDDVAQANAVGNAYNSGWRNQSNYGYVNNQRPNQPYQQYQPQKPSLESIVEKLALAQEKFQLRTEAHFEAIDKQISQLTLAVSRLESKGKLPSQTEPNPRENVNAITLRSGTVIEPKAREDGVQKEEKKQSPPTRKGMPDPTPVPSPYATPPPFPSRLMKRDKQAEEKEILDVFQKVEINIPLLDVIRKIPRYAKFLKDLCTNKRRLIGIEKVNLGEHVSAVFQRKLPPKLKDQGMFAIPCKIGKVGIKRAMCDLGASINVMPLSFYNSLSAEPLKDTKVTIQLADRSIIYPEGLLENVLVKVKDLIFPADFYVIDMENDRTNNSSEILLGRPFLSTANTKIDVRSGILTMEFDGEVVKFDVYKAMRHPDNVASINFIDVIKPAVEEFIESKSIDDSCRDLKDHDKGIKELKIVSSVHSDLRLTPLRSKMFSFILQELNLELKLPPEKLKNEREIFPVKKLHNRKISRREILSWIKRKNWKKYLSQCL
ncbi:hypothetical protein HRI_004136700 [Hibiscus trionum]|uniref:Retrotransposon gag domain-containing protein n=1 Tax=Hibiscus trionum TaxID=183268 RepID=A0A9W7MM92_HIBTR|nr:hypothetical protein HRI_004136700 [Hibiscus trionum]